MPDFLVFQLYGPLAAWGDVAVGEFRPSLSHPTKSAVTGLLGAALGLDRREDGTHQQLSKQYGVAVCVRASGELLRDYHTVQVPGGANEYATRRDELTTDRRNLNTLLSQRDYRTDAFYLVAVWGRQEPAPYPLSALRQALLAPRFALYLGRKSCPLSLPLHPTIASGLTLKAAFDTYPLEPAHPWISALPQETHLNYFWESGLSDAERGDLPASMVYPRRDQVLSRQRWQFTPRNEFHYASPAAEGGP
jgi:CRISPR system Cascade subunit CasD